jgi:hypothetical protein
MKKATNHKKLADFYSHDQAVIFERPRQEVEELKHLLTTRLSNSSNKKNN